MTGKRFKTKVFFVLLTLCVMFLVVVFEREVYSQNNGDVEKATAKPQRHFGICDASAVVSVGADYILVGEDEGNVLALYRLDQTSAPERTYDMNKFLKLNPDDEADIEAVANIGKRLYWIGSHGRNSTGKTQKNRRQFFATEVTGHGRSTQLKEVGEPYRKLLKHILKVPELNTARINMKLIEGLPPTEGGVNIEGLTATPNGELLIGFRSPLTNAIEAKNKQAIILPIKNPAAVVEKGTKVELGKPIFISLDGYGVRSIEWHGGLGKYLILAGRVGNGVDFKLFQWGGPEDRKKPELLKLISLGEGASAEGLMVNPETREVLVVFDEGTRDVDGIACKHQESSAKRSFRSMWVKVPDQN